MRIEVRGRNTEVTDELRRHVEKRFARIGKQVSELAVLEVELREERNPSIADRQVAEATLHLKRVTLRRGHATAKVAVARRLLVRAFIMLRDEIDYAEFCRRGVAARSSRGSA